MSNEKDIKNFIEFKKITNKSKKGKLSIRTINKYIDDLTKFSDYIKKDFKKVKEKEILNFLKHYSQCARNSYIILFRNFYRWLYNLDENERLPDFIKRIKTTRIKKDEIEYRERVITEEEYDKLLKYATQQIHKAIIETLWVCGGRRNAIQSIKSNGVWYDGVKTHIVLWLSKTETREFVEPGRFEHLMLWVEEMQPFKGQENKPLFAVKVRETENEYKQVNGKYTNKILKRICKKAKIRHITPHDFRHTKCTNLLKNGTPETHVKTLLGFSKDSSMLRVYDHNKLKDYEEWLKDKIKETKPTYDLLEKQKKTLEEKHGKEIEQLKEKMDFLEQVMIGPGFDEKTKKRIFELWKKGEGGYRQFNKKLMEKK